MEVRKPPAFLILLILILLAATFYSGFISGGDPEEIEEEEPMLLIIMDSWAENIDDNSERLFDYWVYNFGNVEAKNVSVICEITKNNIIVKSQIFQIGNVASNSGNYEQSALSYFDYNDDDAFGACVIHSADDEYINLYDRIHDL